MEHTGSLLDASLNILFVDDDTCVISALARLMRHYPPQCFFSSDVAHAKNLLASQKIDIIVSDLHMPDTDGMSFFAQTAMQYPEIIRIMLTASSEHELLLQAINEGRVWGFINKPWDNNTLLQTLEQAQRTQQLMSQRMNKLYTQMQDDRNELQTIMNSVDDAIITVNDAGLLATMNKAGMDMFLLPQPLLCESHLLTLLPVALNPQYQDDLTALLSVLAEAESSEQHQAISPLLGKRLELTGRRFDGQSFPLLMTVNIMRHQMALKLVIVMSDLSASHQRERQIELSERLKAAILDSALDCIITINKDGEILEFNPAAERTFGYSREEVVGKSLAETIIPYGFRTQHKQGIDVYTSIAEHNSQQQRKEPRQELKALHKDGHEFPIEIAISAIVVEGESLFTAYLRDISQRKEDEQQLKDAKEKAEQASKAKSDFLAVMSHEIRTPMNAILGSLTILSESQQDGEQRRHLDNAQKAGKAMLWLINDVLDYSKIEAGKLALQFNEFDLIPLVEESVSLMYAKAMEGGIELACVFERGLPSRVYGDDVRLRQILLNLLSNAVKFTHSGGAVVTVRQDKDSLIYFDVRDSGIGIDLNATPELFSKFVQADSAYTREFSGTGLGLAISSCLAEAMSGEMGVESQPGQGSCFWFTVKLEAVHAYEALERLPFPSTVQLSEPNHYLRNALSRQLEELDITVEIIQAQDACIQWQGISDFQSCRLLTTKNDAPSSPYLLKPLCYNELINVLSERDSDANDSCQRSETVTIRSHFKGKRLLLVEDSHANQIVAQTMLERAGFYVDIAANGQEAYDAVRQFDYDLVLMDLSMPVMDGAQATRLIRELPGAKACIPILAMTANVMENDLKHCYSAGMNDYIVKPIDKPVMLKTITDHLLTEQPNPHCKKSAMDMTKNGTSLHFKNKVDQKPMLDIYTDHLGAVEFLSANDSDMNEECLLDAGILQQLEIDTSIRVMPVILQRYFSETRQRLVRMESAMEHAECEELRKEAHALKSSSGTLGAVTLQYYAKELENRASLLSSIELEALCLHIQDIGLASMKALSQRYGVPLN